jgi:hypothetical protein
MDVKYWDQVYLDTHVVDFVLIRYDRCGQQ